MWDVSLGSMYVWIRQERGFLLRISHLPLFSSKLFIDNGFISEAGAKWKKDKMIPREEKCSVRNYINKF